MSEILPVFTALSAERFTISSMVAAFGFLRTIKISMNWETYAIVNDEEIGPILEGLLNR